MNKNIKNIIEDDYWDDNPEINSIEEMEKILTKEEIDDVNHTINLISDWLSTDDSVATKVDCDEITDDYLEDLYITDYTNPIGKIRAISMYDSLDEEEHVTAAFYPDPTDPFCVELYISDEKIRYSSKPSKKYFAIKIVAHDQYMWSPHIYINEISKNNEKIFHTEFNRGYDGIISFDYFNRYAQ